jgi:hypothetical protein
LAAGTQGVTGTAGVGPDIAGTDFPKAWNSKGVDHIPDAAGLSDTDQKAILSSHAAKLLRVTPRMGS